MDSMDAVPMARLMGGSTSVVQLSEVVSTKWEMNSPSTRL